MPRTRAAADEVRRLRNRLAAVTAAYLTELRPQIALETARDWCQAAYRRGFAAGDAAGYARAVEAFKADQIGLVHGMRLEADRWFLYCPACRANGAYRAGCEDCQARTRRTFAQPAPWEVSRETKRQAG